jgi:hypothetical protein
MSSLTLGARICSVAEDHGKPITISESDRKRPLYMIGKPNTGKSNLLEHCIEQDIKNGHGLVFIEPDYNLTPYLLSHIPKERIPHTLIIDFGDHDYPVPLNGLDTPLNPTPAELSMLRCICGCIISSRIFSIYLKDRFFFADITENCYF